MHIKQENGVTVSMDSDLDLYAYRDATEKQIAYAAKAGGGFYHVWAVTEDGELLRAADRALVFPIALYWMVYYAPAPVPQELLDIPTSLE